jgi:hypothetical protein
LDQEISSIHLEQARQQGVVIDVVAVDRVAVAAGTGVDADILAFVGGEAVEHFVVKVDEGVEQFGAGPGVSGIVFGRESSLSEVDADAFRAGGEGAADIFLALFTRECEF